jgi:polygalacturonase
MREQRVKTVALALLMAACLMIATGCSQVEEPPEATGAWAQVADILAQIHEPNIPDRQFNITEYGAVGDGQTNCYEAFVAAVAACEAAEGGRVLVPAGTYLVNGPIHFASNMNLHLAEGSHIKFGGKYIDYLPLAMTRWQGTRVYNYSPFIYAYRKHHISLTGSGTLDGQAQDTWSTWTEKEATGAENTLKMNEEGNSVIDRFLGDGHFLRPSMIQFLGCDNVLIEGVKIVNSPFRCLHPVFSKQMTIRNIEFDAQNPDNDGIALDSCEDVDIHDVTFNNRGAGIAIKSGAGREGRELGRPSRNIYIHDCTFNAETALAIDSEISAGVYNIFAENCQAAPGSKPAVAIADSQTAGGEIAHVHCRNMMAVPASEPNAPNVYAGPDVQLAEQGGAVTLSGSVSDDGQPTGTLTYAWSIIQGDADAVTIADAASLRTQATFSQSGVYILKLEASDGEATGFHFLMVKVGEQPDGMEAVKKPIFSAR